MAKYAVGDRVRVTNDTEGQPVELIDAVGTVALVQPLVLERVRPVEDAQRRPQYIQEYTVDLDGSGRWEDIWEEWLLPVALSN